MKNELPSVHSPGMTRREFLKVAGAVGAGIKTGVIGYLIGEWLKNLRYDPDLKILLDNKPEVSFSELEQLTLRLDKVFDLIPPVKVDLTPESIANWRTEILPMYEYNGLDIRWQVKEQGDIDLQTYTGASGYNHIAGRSTCDGLDTSISSRFDNPISAWYQELFGLTALVHELAHDVQGPLCEDFRLRPKIEVSAQLAAIEVMSNMASGGNRLMFAAVVDELRDMSLSAALWRAFQDDDLPRFHRLRERVSPSAFSAARLDRAMRYWESNDATFKAALLNYNYEPIRLIIEASAKGWEMEGLALPVTQFSQIGSMFRYYSEPPPFKLDDLRYLLRHAEEMAMEMG